VTKLIGQRYGNLAATIAAWIAADLDREASPAAMWRAPCSRSAGASGYRGDPAAPPVWLAGRLVTPSGHSIVSPTRLHSRATLNYGANPSTAKIRTLPALSRRCLVF